MINGLARTIIERGTELGLMVATAESCTGGLIAGALTEIPGSSAVFDRGFVTYSNEAKSQMLGVPIPMIEAQGAVSEIVARAMTAGALDNSRADLVAAVTGVAGPGGGTAEKPVGLVFIAAQRRDSPPIVNKCHFPDNSRSKIRAETVKTALEMMLDQLG